MASMMTLTSTLMRLQNARAIIGHNPLSTKLFVGATPKPFQAGKRHLGMAFKDEARNRAEKGVDAAKQGVDMAKKSSQEAKNETVSIADEVMRKTKVMGDKVADAAQDMAGKAKEIAQEEWGSVKDTTKKMKDTMMGKAEESKEAIKNNSRVRLLKTALRHCLGDVVGVILELVCSRAFGHWIGRSCGIHGCDVDSGIGVEPKAAKDLMSHHSELSGQKKKLGILDKIDGRVDEPSVMSSIITKGINDINMMGKLTECRVPEGLSLISSSNQEVGTNAPSPGYQTRSVVRDQAANPHFDEENDSSTDGSSSSSDSSDLDEGSGNEATSSPAGDSESIRPDVIKGKMLGFRNSLCWQVKGADKY
ncbi:hypothetical protein HAX54_032802 [Datura stramonium]|uniref:Uncharacterized protein n=1 Tax=Datura stramonium TaxID=4076 RepID=A0ABS8VE02_DATST|nr:hypothetical protein [Datura stramonium]